MKPLSAPAEIAVRGPYFDELTVGDVFDQAPAVTLDAGMQAAHRAIVGNRLRLSLDSRAAEAVTGGPTVAAPALVWDVSIGQSTVATQHVKANLFYRGLRFRRFPRLGDTLATTTTVTALRENSARAGRPRTGMAALRIVTRDQLDRVVLDYWRCAMLPVSREDAREGPRDDLDGVGAAAPGADDAGAIAGWDLAAFGSPAALPPSGSTWRVDGADVVSSAPELARLTGNLAAVHHDADAAGGRRLVYGGHTIGLALHQITRALPELITVLSWTRCDHLAPVYEGDHLTSTITVEGARPLDTTGALVTLRSRVRSRRPTGESVGVLDWTLTGVIA